MARQYGSRLHYWSFILNGHILNPFWHDRVKRRTRRNYYNYKRVAAYLRKYLPFIDSLKVEKDNSKDTWEEKIFSIWWQGEENAPKIVKICFERLRNLYKEKFIVLDDSNIRQWVKLPDFVWEKWEKGQILRANMSDICRIALLLQHGGMWFDATDYLTSEVPEWIEKCDVFLYIAGERFTPEKFVQICFIRGKKNNPLLKLWLDFILKYWEEEDFIIDYFLHQFMLRFLVENNKEVAELFYSMPQVSQTPTHLLWHLHKNDNYSETLYQDCTKDTFFQKTCHKASEATFPKEGSVADYIVNKKIPETTSRR
ncbi:MAG: hypothetical protein J1F12_05070 [Muribaculaceae bacterium]|nr:hypothetical protein [Muribaculaceae bacterium]